MNRPKMTPEERARRQAWKEKAMAEVLRYQRMTPEERAAAAAEFERRAKADLTRRLLDADDLVHDRSNPHHVTVESDHHVKCACGWTGPIANLSRHLEEVMQAQHRDSALSSVGSVP